MPLRYLSTPGEVQEILRTSDSESVWILKHSDECGLSARALTVFEKHSERSPSIHGVIVVQDAPHLSRWLEQHLNVLHETPQALLVVKGQARWNASHRRITLEALTEAER